MFPYLVPVITLSAFSVLQESCFFFSQWNDLNSQASVTYSYFSQLTWMLFLGYRMSHQDLFSAHQTTYATLLKHLKLRFSIVYFYHCYFGSLLLFIVNSSYLIQDQVSALVGVVCVEIFWSRHWTLIEPLSFCTLFRFWIVFFLGGGLGRGSKGLRESSQAFFGRMVHMLDFIITKPRGQVFQ